MGLAELIREVSRQAASDDPLDRLAAAAEHRQDMVDQLDDVLDHFVHEARDAGCSWTDIGDVLGVSKQAAQQRHRRGPGRGGRGRARGRFARFTPTARRAVLDAHGAARLLGDRAVYTEHVLLGLLESPGTLASDVLSHWDVDRDGIEAAILARRAGAGAGDEGAGEGGAAGDEQVFPRYEALVSGGQGRKGRSRRGHVPFTASCKKVLEVALREAHVFEHDYIGTEHVLLGLIRVREGLAAQLLAERGVTMDAVRQAVATASTGD
jgi:ATP-dependent Clp protease ATP-binding subunit ClpA